MMEFVHFVSQDSRHFGAFFLTICMIGGIATELVKAFYGKRS